MLRIAICEDHPPDAALLKKCIEQDGRSSQLRLFTQGSELLAGFSRGQYDLLFLDIYLPDITGTELAAALRKIDRDVVIAFTTSSEDHALTGYRVNALKYLLKPVQPQDVSETMTLAQQLRGRRSTCTVFVHQQKVELELEEICYVEVHDHTCRIHTTSATLESGNTMEEMTALLPPPRFLKCHRSFIVNLDYVRGVDRDFIMENGDKVYIRGKDLSRMKNTWTEYLFQMARES